MSTTVRIPSQLRSLTGGASEVVVPAGTVGEAIAQVDTLHPSIAQRLLDESGQLRRFVNVYVDEEDVRFLDGLQTAVTEGSVVSVIPSIAGG